MDRQIVYLGQIPLETDQLNQSRATMVAIGALASALFGTTAIANNLPVTATPTPSMSVQVGAGEFYAVENLDSTSFSSLPADGHQIVKQGIMLDPTAIACPAPTTAGQSIAYLIQATFAEVDANPVELPYYNASNPTQAFSGPANSGASQPTVRKGTVVVTAKAGAAASTGSQTAPSADPGYIGLAVVTVAYGATSITGGNISVPAGAPVVPSGGILAAIKAISYASRAETQAGALTTKGVTPDGLAQAIQSGGFLYAQASGTASALVVTLNPAPAAYPAGMEIIVKATTTNAAGATLTINGNTAAITSGGSPIQAGMMKAGQLYALLWDTVGWQIKSPSVAGIVASVDGTTGYDLYSNGRLRQWGHGVTTGTSGGQVVTFPIPFPNALQGSSATNDANGPPVAWHGTDAGISGAGGITGMTVWCNTTSGPGGAGTAFRWEAWGN